MKHILKTFMLLAALIVLSGCEDDNDNDPAPSSSSANSSGGGGHTYSWQDPSTISRSYTYEVVVINTRNQIIPGALVTFEVEGYWSARQAMTNVDGLVSFSFNCPPNKRANILAQSTGYRSGALSVITGANPSQVYFITLADL